MKTMKLLWLLVIGIVASATAAPKSRICAQYPEDDSSQDDEDYSEYVSSSPEAVVASTRSSRSVQPSGSLQTGSFVECSQDYDFCFGLWTPHANGTKVVKQGCWKESGDRNVTCVQKECLTIGHKRTNVNGDVNVYYYCCCSGDMCNQNMTVSYPLELTNSVISRDVEHLNGDGSTQVLGMNWPNRLIMLAFCFGIVAVISGFMFVRCNKPGDMPGPEAAPLAPSGPGYSSNLQNVDNLKLCSMVGQGKYGTVWKGMINERAVAVKIFPAQHKQCFINEKNIYSLPLMECPSLLSYFGCDERRTMDDRIEYFLVLSLAPLGCLQDWLIANTATFGTFCKMAKTITRGLSHLHTELQRGDDLKPCIAHRDLNTRNILVNADLTCAIADFGFALKVFGSKYEYRGEAAFAEIKSINEVGTLRYMAPEILEGAVNLRDCESALKQTDVYSLGLVLWELCTRCSEFYAAGQAIPPYKSPYEAEVGKHPTFEQMQVLVARHKARPLFPAGWGGAAAGKLVRDTCEDCWDHDAEARLTSLCAEERMHELCNLRPRSHISLGGHGPSPPLSANNFVGQSPTRRLRSFSSNSCNLETEQNIVTPPNQIIPRVRSCGNDATSPIVGLHSAAATEKNHLIHSQQIQPYQGRNPCQERNLAPVAVKATPVLVEKSKKHSFQDKSQDNSFSCLEDDVSVEDLISANSKKLAQDAVHMGQGFPKQNNTDKKLRGWHGVRALIQKKLFRKDFYQSFDEKSNLVDNRSCSKPIPEITSPTKNTTVNLIENKHHNCQNSILTTIDSSTTRRPNNLDLVPITVRVNGLSPENKSNLIKSISEEYQCSLKFSPDARSTQSAVDDSHTKPITSSAAAALRNIPKEPQTRIRTPSEEKQIVRQRSLEIFREVFNARSNSTDHRLRNPSQRVKTPGDVPPSVRKVRASKTLSLYDDRMMDSSTLNIL